MQKGEKDFPKQIEAIRRTDVSLRAEFPYLTTRIFEITSLHFQICFDAALLKADSARPVFEKSIRPVGLMIELSNQIPDAYLQEIAPMRDRELAQGFAGFSFTLDDLKTIILSKCHLLPELTSINQTAFPTITVCFARELTTEEKKMVSSVLAAWEPAWPFDFKVEREADAKEANTLSSDLLKIRPAKIRPLAPPFVAEDEAFWFDNIESIFAGGFAPDNISVSEPGDMTCYLDCTSFPQVDIRQCVLCFDTVFLSPPRSDSTTSEFWQSQAVSRDDILELVDAGRVKFVLTQPEERTDPIFLSEVYKTNQTAIIGRRKSAALIAADIVQTSNEYFFAQPQFVAQVTTVAPLLAAELNWTESDVIEFLLWPIIAQRKCLGPLLYNGLMSIGNFGVGGLLGNLLKRTSGKDYTFESLVTTQGVHVAHALNATFFPPAKDLDGWIEPRCLVGRMLDFYRSFNTRIAASWVGNERRREERINLLPAIPLFEFDRHAKISHLIKTTSVGSTRRKGRALVSRLANLPQSEREAEIERLTGELFESGWQQAKRKLALETFTDIAEIGAAVADLNYGPVTNILGLVTRTVRAGRRIRALDRFLDDLEADLLPNRKKNEDVHFLSKVERVAQLRLKM